MIKLTKFMKVLSNRL